MDSGRSDTVLVAYVPTPHAGYLRLFRAHEHRILYVLGEELIAGFPSLVRHLPGVRPMDAVSMIRALDIFPDVRILTPGELDAVRQSESIAMPDEDVAHALAEKYFAGIAIMFDGRWRLRWDWRATQKNRRPDDERVISHGDFDLEMMRTAYAIAQDSPDWWRQIGALLARDGAVLLSAFNRHLPSDQSAYCYGDPRSNCEQGEHIELSLALHAEAGIIAEASKRGIRTEGCDLYVTTFPCPPCAYLLAHTGIKKLFYSDGYSLVAGAEVLQAKGVEIIRV